MKNQPIIRVLAASTVLMLVGFSCGNVATPPEPQSCGCSTIESLGSQSTAEIGDDTISSYNNAAIHFIVAGDDGAGITTLAPAGHTGDQNSIIALPAGWTLATPQVSSGGCTLKPTNIFNAGNGRYKIAVVTSAVAGVCPWGSGDYVYHLMIDAGGFQGATIGKIVIQ